VALVETRTDGPCPHQYVLTRTWTTTDRCDNAASATQVVTVVDTTPPELVVPPPLVIECTGPDGVSADDPLVAAWLAAASSSDNCSGALPVSNDAPAAFPVACPDPVAISVTFLAVDECGNETLGVSSVTVVDTTPPAFVSVDLPTCLWPPNHRSFCLEDVAAQVVAIDTCSTEVRVFVESCASDQPDEAPEEGDRGGRELGNGDGHHEDDCVVAPDGSAVCLRLERQGTDPTGRDYTLVLVALDDCGNEARLPWTVHVPHDQRGHGCPKVDAKDLLGPREPFPWER
jgi:hypothetical protein